MIEAYIKETKNGSITLSVNGHAGAAEAGQDIVCASVSILAYTLAEFVLECEKNNKLKKKPYILLKKGRASVTCEPKKEYYDDIKKGYSFVSIGLKLLAHNYPQYVLNNVW